MAWFRSAFLSALILTALVPAQAQEDCPALVSAALDATGTDDLIRTLPAAIRDAVIDQMQPWAHNPDGIRVIQTVARNFGPGVVANEFRIEFASACNIATLKAVIANMNTPLAVRMHGLETLAKSAQARPQLNAFVDQLSRQQPPASRLRLLSRLDSAIETQTLLQEGFQAVVKGLAFKDGDPPLSAPALERVHNQMLVSLLFAYRDCTDQELDLYARTLEAPAMLDFRKQYRLTFVGLMTTQAREMGYQLRSSQAPSTRR
jgi:hypothetical protein